MPFFVRDMRAVFKAKAIYMGSWKGRGRGQGLGQGGGREALGPGGVGGGGHSTRGGGEP